VAVRLPDLPRVVADAECIAFAPAVIALASRYAPMPDDVPFVGEDPRILEALRLVSRVAATPATVLVTGETGTGKELIARMLHAQSDRATRSFLALNCGAIAESLLESELFGHTRGAFTGANTRQAGKFEAAHRGTLFLDEVASMSPAMQSSLLRVLQSGEYCPVGMAHPIQCDVRVVAAANRELRDLVAGGSFRADLFYRLNIIRIALPPLRDRRGDLPALIAHLTRAFAMRYARPARRFDDLSMRRMMAYDYPGNVRELETIIHRATLLSDGPALSCDGLLEPADTIVAAERADAAASTFHRAKATVVERFEREYLESALRRNHGVITDAARDSGLSERIFHLKLRKYGLRRRGSASAEVGAG
jgi:DNA-binding NtrC family response regulator